MQIHQDDCDIIFSAVLEGGVDKNLTEFHDRFSFIHLYQGGKITLILKEPIDGLWTGGKREYGRILTEFAKLLETYILTYPEQYGGFYGPTVLSDHYQSQRMPEKEATDTLEE